MPQPFINIHSHRKPQSWEEIVVRNAYIPHNTNLAYPISIGIHPWFIGENWQAKMDKLRNLATQKQVVAIGETGLDRAITIPFSLQQEVLEAHIDLANSIKKPLIFHAVRSYSDFPFFLKKISQQAVFHGFEGNLTQVQSLLQYPVFFSFGKKLLNPSTKIKEVVDYIPLNRIFLETDTEPISIQNIYQKMAEMKGIALEELKLQIAENYNQWINGI